MKDDFLKIKAAVIEQLQVMGKAINRVAPDLQGDVEVLVQQFQNELAFTVLCLGDFSSGKTTFVNRFFLDNAILPVRATPTTAKITILRYGEPLTLLLKMRSGQVESYSENIADVVNQAGAKDGGKLDEVEAIELIIPSVQLKEGIIIVDSPGLNDPEIERSKVTTDYMDRCDCILFFLNATQAWKRSEKEFIEERIFSKQHFNKIFFLLNFWDCIDDKERPEVLKYVKEQMDKSTKIMKSNLQGQGEEVNDPFLIPVSAKSGENIENLEKVLWTYLADKCGRNLLKLKISKVFNFVNAVFERIDESVDVHQKEQYQIEKDIERLEIEVAQFARGVEDFRVELYDRIASSWKNYVKEIEGLFFSLGQKIGKEIGAGLGTIRTLADKNDIEKMITNRARRAIHQHQPKFRTLESDFVEECRSQIRAMKADLNLRQGSFLEFQSNIDPIELHSLEIDDHITTLWAGVGGMVAVAAILGVMTGGVGALLAPAVLPLIEKYRIGQIRENLQERLPELEDSVKIALNARFEEIVQSREKLFEKIFENTHHDILELYREKKKLLDDALKNKEAKTDQEILAQAENTKQELHSIQSRLSVLVEDAFCSII